MNASLPGAIHIKWDGLCVPSLPPEQCYDLAVGDRSRLVDGDHLPLGQSAVEKEFDWARLPCSKYH